LWMRIICPLVIVRPCRKTAAGTQMWRDPENRRKNKKKRESVLYFPQLTCDS
jgi:hypothetical protein